MTAQNSIVSVDYTDPQLPVTLSASMYPGASRDSIGMVIEYCRQAKLDPLQKPVHIVPMWDSGQGKMRDVIMPGVSLYRIQASRTGECAGIDEPEFGDDVTETIGGQEITYPKWCRVTVYRMIDGQRCAFTAREFWRENYAVKGGRERSIAPNAMWSKRPYGQLAKCAEAQALRKAFPELCAGYTAEEMEGKELAPVIDVTPPKQEPAMYPPADFERNLPKWREAIENGKKTPDQIITMVQAKGRLTDEQKVKIRGEEPAPIEGEIV